MAQEESTVFDFGYHPGFSISEVRLEKCKTYYDSSAHLLFNPCLDNRNKGIYSSYFARMLLLGNCKSCDSVLVVMPHAYTDLDWESLQELQKDSWDYYYKLWQKQDKLEKYSIDLEGLVEGIRSKPF